MTVFAGSPKSDAVRAVMQGNRRRDTKPELLLRSALHRSGSRFRVDFPIRTRARMARPDIAFPGARVAVFVDGCFWHRCPDHGVDPRHNSDYWRSKLRSNVERDELVNSALVADGWKVVRIWEHTPVDEAVFLVQSALHTPPP